MTRTAVFRRVVVRQGDMPPKFPDWVTCQTLQAPDCAVWPLLLLSAGPLARSVSQNPPLAPSIRQGTPSATGRLTLTGDSRRPSTASSSRPPPDTPKGPILAHAARHLRALDEPLRRAAVEWSSPDIALEEWSTTGPPGSGDLNAGQRGSRRSRPRGRLPNPRKAPPARRPHSRPRDRLLLPDRSIRVAALNDPLHRATARWPSPAPRPPRT